MPRLCEFCPRAFALHLRKMHGKTSVRVRETSVRVQETSEYKKPQSEYKKPQSIRNLSQSTETSVRVYIWTRSCLLCVGITCTVLELASPNTCYAWKPNAGLVTYIGLDFTGVYSDAYNIMCGVHAMNVEFSKCRHVMRLRNQETDNLKDVNTLRTGSFKFFKCLLPGFLTILTL